MRRRVLAALLLFALLPGCALFDRGADESISGPHVKVSIVTLGPQPVKGQILLEQSASESVAHNVTVAAASSVEKGVRVDPDRPATLRFAYTTDSGGRASRGSVAESVTPFSCPGIYRITFTMRTDESVVTGSSAHECVV